MQPAVPNFATRFNNYVSPPQNAFLSAFQQPGIFPLNPQPKLIPQQAMPQNPPMLQQMMQNQQFQQALQTYQNVLNQQQIMRGMDTLLQHLLYQSSRTLQTQICHYFLLLLKISRFQTLCTFPCNRLLWCNKLLKSSKAHQFTKAHLCSKLLQCSETNNLAFKRSKAAAKFNERYI